MVYYRKITMFPGRGVMAEQLYTIPVNDAFSEDCECPLCSIYKKLEEDAIEFTMGPSYMEDDNREVTDKLGFCKRHVKMMYANKNRLGLALMLDTHMKKVMRDLKKAAESPQPKKSLFGGTKEKSAVEEYVGSLDSSCFVCDRIETNFPRYVNTVFHLWKKDSEFKVKFKACKGFCIHHYGMLYSLSRKEMSGTQYEEFLAALNKVFFDNFERVEGDVSWFIDKYDYRNKDADWKNSRDAIPRAIIKVNDDIVE